MVSVFSMGPRSTFATAATTASPAPPPCSGSSASVAAWPSQSHPPIPAAAIAAAIQSNFLRDIFPSPFPVPMSTPPAFSVAANTCRISSWSPEYFSTRVFAGLVLRLSGDLLLNGGRRPEPQTRGETRLGRRDYFLLFSLLPLSRMHHSEP